MPRALEGVPGTCNAPSDIAALFSLFPTLCQATICTYVRILYRLLTFCLGISGCVCVRVCVCVCVCVDLRSCMPKALDMYIILRVSPLYTRDVGSPTSYY